MKDRYNDQMRKYKKKAKALAELDNYIESTVDRTNHTIIEDLTTLYEKLKALKEKWSSRVKLEQWLRDYRNAFLQAKAVKLSLVNDT